MAITVRCPGCSAGFRVKDEHAGRSTKCPKCGAPFTIPDSPDAEAVAPAVEAPAVAAAPPAEPAPAFLASGEEARRPLFDPDAAPASVAPPAAPKSPNWLWIGVGASLVAVLLLGGGLWAAGAFEHKKVVKKDEPARPTRTKKTDVNREAFFQPDQEKVKENARRPRPAENAPLEELIKYFDNGVVKIEVTDFGGNVESLGSGFVIDESGLVATNFHVIEDAYKARVAFRDGTLYSVIGVRAFDPAMDLAILELNGVPNNIEPLTLAVDERLDQGKEVLAIGHPHGYEFSTTRGIVSAVRETKSFPADTRRFLAKFADDFEWIQHDAAIASGNSGGPILNRRGDVLGVNTWVDTQAKTHFASHVKYLAQLRQRMSPVATPLYQMPRERSDERISPEMVRTLRTGVVETGWNPADDEQYLEIQKLALLTLIFEGEATFREETKATSEALRTAAWDARKQIPKINDFAVDAIAGSDDRVPVFLVASVAEAPEETEDKNGACWVTLFGTDQKIRLLTRRAKTLGDVAVGDSIAVMGVVVERMAVGEQRLNKVTVPVVAAGVVAPIKVAAGDDETPKS